MSGSSEFRCSFHGIGIRVIGAAAMVAAVGARLGELSQDDTPAGLTFEYEEAGVDGRQAIEKPSGTGRPFYVAPGGEALYYPDGDLLYLSHGDRAQALCRASEGHCRICLSGHESGDVWLGAHLLFTIPLLEMLKRRGCYSLHAAAFALEGRCVLLAGTSGVGKSTLTVCHLRAGLSFMGDDMTFFRETNGIRALAFPEPIDISDATASFFPELSAIASSPRRPGWPKHEIRASDFFGNDVTWSATPDAIVFPRIGNRAESQLSAIGSNEAFLELVPNVLLTDPASTKEHVALLARLAQAAPAYRLQAGRDFDRIAELVTGLLSTGCVAP